MRKTVKCVISSVLTASMVMSIASCSLFDKAGKLCTEVGDEFMKAALERDIDDLCELCSDEDDAAAALESYMGDNDPVQALLDRATFSAGKPDCSTKDKKGSIEYTITLPDYDAALDEDPEDVDEFEDLLDETKDTVEIKVTLDFKLKKDDWLIDNPEDVAEDLYDELFSVKYGFESPRAHLIDHEYFYGSSDDVYTNVSSLDLDVYFTDSEHFDYYFTVSYQGNIIYTSSERNDYGYIYCYCYYDNTSIYDDNNWYYPAGEYTYNVYDGDDALIVSHTCTVVNNYD